MSKKGVMFIPGKQSISVTIYEESADMYGKNKKYLVERDDKVNGKHWVPETYVRTN